MGFFIYQKLPENRRGKGGFPAREWVVVKRAAVKVVGVYVGKRRWAARHARRLTRAAFWARLRKAVGLTRARRVPAASYDSVSYSQNFDDGVWKEEEEFWRSGSFAYRYGRSGRLVSRVVP